MKITDMIMIAAAAFTLYMVLSKRGATVETGKAGAQPAPGTKLIGVYDGWQYFTDGTTIGPDGSYYVGGILVYTPK